MNKSDTGGVAGIGIKRGRTYSHDGDYQNQNQKKKIKLMDIEYHVYTCYDIPTFENNSVNKEK